MTAVHTRRTEMSKAKLQYLAAKASDAFIDNGVDLTESVTKIAREHNLNPDELARVCELANLKSFDMAVKKAAKNTVKFDLADIHKVRKALNMTEAAKTKTAAATLEYSISPEFLKAFEKEAYDINTKEVEERIANAGLKHKLAKQHNEDVMRKLQIKKLTRELEAEKIALEFKLFTEVADAVNMVKTAALRKLSNPFTMLPVIISKHPNLKEAANNVFKRAAEELTTTWSVNIEDMLQKATKEAAQVIKNETDILGKDGTSIVKKLDTISGYMDLYKKIQNGPFKTNDSTELTQAPWNKIIVKETVDNTPKIDIDK